jgi:predicted Co/Zn/Cd cation transporter (cation efflux family)
MLRLALSLLSSLQIGYRLKEAGATALKQIAVLTIAGLLLLAAATFSLVASYHALVAHGFAPFEAAALVAMSLTIVALLILLVGPASLRRARNVEEASSRLFRLAPTPLIKG